MNASFPRTARLTHRSDYNYVFQAPERKSSDRCFTVLGRYCLQGHTARIGLVIAKRQIRRAHERNRIKRLIRESFRHWPEREGRAIDIVIIARSSAQNSENVTITNSLQRHWQRLFT
ncbi:MAG: ribonuclease P protein component [Cardiobacteriaceae bacterium]|nr:ribonuclease P protein component [Cardiobacteriaceae bacterium]